MILPLRILNTLIVYVAGGKIRILPLRILNTLIVYVAGGKDPTI